MLTELNILTTIRFCCAIRLETLKNDFIRGFVKKIGIFVNFHIALKTESGN